MRVLASLTRRRWAPGRLLRSPRKKLSSFKKGQELEQRVKRLFQELGWTYVQSNVRVKDARGHWSELDIVVGRWIPIYVECKNFEKPIPLDEVAKFKEVLRLNRIGLWRGLFVASGGFSPRATHTGIRTWDGEQLARMERIASVVYLWRRSWRWILRLAFASLFFFCCVFPWMLRVKALRERIAEWDPQGRLCAVSYRVRQQCRAWADRVLDTDRFEGNVREQWERVQTVIKERVGTRGEGPQQGNDTTVVENEEDVSKPARAWEAVKDKVASWRRKCDSDDGE